jgi:hypothetical protein
MGFILRWQLNTIAGIVLFVWIIIYFSIIVCYILTYVNERRQLTSKVFTNIPFRDRKCGTYFTICLAAAFYINLGVIILDLIGITLSIMHKDMEGILELLLLLGDLILAKHLLQKLLLVSKRLDGEYSMFAETHMALNSHNGDNAREHHYSHASPSSNETTHLISNQGNAGSSYANAAVNVAVPYQTAYIVKIDA